MLNSFFKLLFLGLLSVVLFSCGEEDILTPTDNLTITVDESSTYTTNDFEIGEKVRITVNITAPEGITIFGIDKIVNGGAAQSITSDFSNVPNPGATTFTSTYDIPVSEAVGAQVQIVVKAISGTGSTFRSDSYTYEVVAQGQGGGGGVFPLLRAQVTVALGSQDNTNTGSYFNSALGTSGVYLSAAVEALSNAQKAAIDITFGVIGTTSTLISPSARAGAGFNNPMGAQASITSFKTEAALTGINAVTSSDVENDINHSSGSVFTQNIAAGSVYSFINAAGAKGYIKVTSITGSGTNTTANLDVIVQTIQ